MQYCDYLHWTMKGNEGNYCTESRHLLGSRDSLTMFCALIFGNSTGNKVCIMRRLNFEFLHHLRKKETHEQSFLAKNKKENIEWHFSSSVTSSTNIDLLFFFSPLWAAISVAPPVFVSTSHHLQRSAVIFWCLLLKWHVFAPVPRLRTAGQAVISA